MLAMGDILMEHVLLLCEYAQDAPSDILKLNVAMFGVTMTG